MTEIILFYFILFFFFFYFVFFAVYFNLMDWNFHEDDHMFPISFFFPYIQI